MLVAALAFVYLACCALLLSVYLQDRANAARARRRREADRRLEFQTHH
jgi:hypothetical protein